jgi:transposase
MAMYVVLRFEDDDEANTFVSGTGIAESEVINEDFNPLDVVGMYKAPTQFCDNQDGHRRIIGKMDNGTGFGKKWGWVVCRICGKPLEYSKESHRMFMTKNLLEDMEKL